MGGGTAAVVARAQEKYPNSVLEASDKRCPSPRAKNGQHKFERQFEDGFRPCILCGLEQQQEQIRPGFGVEKFSRAPTNAAVFRNNHGSTSKTFPDKPGAEPIHQIVVASVHGSLKYGVPKLERVIKSCPTCKTENVLPVFGESVFCQVERCGTVIVTCKRRGCKAQNIAFRKCHICRKRLPVNAVDRKKIDKAGRPVFCACNRPDPYIVEPEKCVSCHRLLKGSPREFVRTQLGEFVLSWLPTNPEQYGKDSDAAGFMKDLRSLGDRWDPQEEDPVVKMAKEAFRKLVYGKIPDEQAHFLAQKVVASVQILAETTKKDVVNQVMGVLENNGIEVEA